MNKRPTKNTTNTPIKKEVKGKTTETIKATKAIPEPNKKMVITKNGIEYVEQKPKVEKSKDSRKFIKMVETQSAEEFKIIGDRVSRKELKWAYYTTENNVGVHYYLILNE
jgi:hypothetical protein